MALIPFPNVPASPGVPALPRSASFPPAASAVLSAVQGAIWRIFQVQTQWGIFDKNGRAVADPSKFTGLVGVAIGALGLLGDTTMSTSSVDYSKETRASDFPVELGSFGSFNKVELPAMPLVTLAFCGSKSDRASFLNALDMAVKSTDLYRVVTPEKVYADYTIERYALQRRAERGATLLIVDISLKEIRQVSAQYAKTQINEPKQSTATPPVDGGKIQPTAPEQSTLKATATKLGV